MRKIVLLLVMVFSVMMMWAENYASNARAVQVERTMVITYDLSETSNVRLLISTNMSNGFKVLKQVTGDVGKNVPAGTNRQIIWNVLEEYDRFVADGVRFMVDAWNIDTRLEYVDLGLPSGTLWKKSNEGGDSALYTYDEAVRKFVNNLPTMQQLEELKSICTWTWTGNGYKVIGPNGNSIYLPAAGFLDGSNVYSVQMFGGYWSATEYNSNEAYCLYFVSSLVDMDGLTRINGLSVRLVMDLQ